MEFLLILFLSLAACSHHDKSQPTSNDVEPLHTKATNYLAWSVAQSDLIDDQGFPTDDPCDALERACFRLVGGGKVNYLAAQDTTAAGLWYRDSAHQCGPVNGTSSSRFSRDMALGLGLCLWQSGDTASAKSVVSYVNANGGYIDPAAQILFSPMLSYLYGAVIAKAANTPLPIRPIDPNIDNTSTSSLTDALTGYIAHLTEVGIYWDGVMSGGVATTEMDVLKDQVARQPRNALYQAFLHKYTDGDQSAALAIANDESLFPSDRLPSSCDRAASYLWERDDGADWQPDPTTPQGQCKVWSGTDLIFLYAVVADELRGDKTSAALQ